MKISLKLEYACRVLAQLAREHQNGKLSHIDELAEAEAIPKNYLVQILSELRNGGLIVSRRGKQGGYGLKREPANITLCEIIRVIDADMLGFRFSREGESGEKTAEIWTRLAYELENAASRYTLASFIPDTDADMFHI